MKSSSSTGSMARLNAGAAAWASMDKVVRNNAQRALAQRVAARNAQRHRRRAAARSRGAAPRASCALRGRGAARPVSLRRANNPVLAQRHVWHAAGAADVHAAHARELACGCAACRAGAPGKCAAALPDATAPASSVGVAFCVCHCAVLRCRRPERGAVHAHIRRPCAPGTHAAAATMALEPRVSCTNPADAVVNTRCLRCPRRS
jgi:hypothetical protein